MRTRQSAIAVILSTALAVAACGSAGGSGTASTTVSTVPAGTAPTGFPASTLPPTTLPPTSLPPTTGVPVGEPGPEHLEPLIPGHNRVHAERINLVFASHGWDDADWFREVAFNFLGWDGSAVMVDQDNVFTSDPARAVGAELGLFGIEPFRSNRHLFNVWITDLVPVDGIEWLNAAGPFDIPRAVVVTLGLDPAFGSHAGQDQVVLDPGMLGRGGDDPFANVFVGVRSEYPLGTILEVPHELGHAMFALADEYVGRVDADPTPRNDFWPSCVGSLEVAQEWWGDLIGDYDPMIDVWVEEMSAVGFTPDPTTVDRLRDNVRTAYVETGCFGVPGSYRSAEDTLMGFNVPAFGLTNRLWAEQVLAQYSGE